MSCAQQSTSVCEKGHEENIFCGEPAPLKMRSDRSRGMNLAASCNKCADVALLQGHADPEFTEERAVPVSAHGDPLHRAHAQRAHVLHC